MVAQVSPSNDLVTAIARVSSVPTILKLITDLTGLRLSLVAEVTESTWTCVAVNDELGFGLKTRGTLDLHTTLCKEVRESQTAIVISHASQDPQYCTHQTPKMYAFESYISVPIFTTSRGYVGNLCALDAKPIKLDDRTVRTFEVFSQLIAVQLELEWSSAVMSKALLEERETAELRETFIAVLGHDLRTPLSSIAVGVGLLRTQEVPAQRDVLVRLDRSVRKMAKMIEDVLDFARGRLGAGIPIDARDDVQLDDVVRAMVEEARAAHQRTISIDGSAGAPLKCDPLRVAQAVSNLLANAAQHGAAETPIQLTMHSLDDRVEIAVSNQGKTIPLHRIATIFEPFRRGDSNQRSGLGLGLFIVSEVARAHMGHVSCTSLPAQTTFTLMLPR